MGRRYFFVWKLKEPLTICRLSYQFSDQLTQGAAQVVCVGLYDLRIHVREPELILYARVPHLVPSVPEKSKDGFLKLCFGTGNLGNW